MDTKKYDSLATYLSLAKKMISKFAPKYYRTLAFEMLNDEDAVSDVAYAIMSADWKYDSERIGKNTGKKKTKYSYRNQCAIWAIKTYITQKYKNSSKKPKISYDPDIHIPNKQEPDTLSIIIEKENDIIKTECVRKLLSSDILSSKQKEHIQLYYFDNLTLSEIGKRYGVTREAIRQSLIKGIEKIKSYV